MVSAWASRQRLVLGQEATAEKSNEIEAIPLLLERLALTGALITIDAMGATARIAQAILDRSADYFLALKGNQGHLFEEAELYFRDLPAAETERYETVDGDHGRIETRRHCVSRDIAWLRADRAAPDELCSRVSKPSPWSSARLRAAAEPAWRGATISPPQRSTPSPSLAPCAPTWGVENRLHWVLDVVFHDDLARLRTGHGPENMAIVKHMALNLLNRTARTDSLKTRRKRAGWDEDYLEASSPKPHEPLQAIPPETAYVSMHTSRITSLI